MEETSAECGFLVIMRIFGGAIENIGWTRSGEIKNSQLVVVSIPFVKMKESDLVNRRSFY